MNRLILSRIARTLSRSTPSLLQPFQSIKSFTSAPPFKFDSPLAIPPTNSTPQQLLAFYAQIAPKAVTLDDLTNYGVPPLSKEVLLESAEHTRKELLCGLARRVTAHLSLPYLPATNPSLQSIYQLYSNAFFNLSTLNEIKTLEDNDKLCEIIEQMVDEHRDNIPVLAKGFQESRKYLPASVITSFLNRAIRNRITLRLRAEQHLSLSSASLPSLRPSLSSSSSSSSNKNTLKDPRIEPSARVANFNSTSLMAASRIGVLDLALSPGDMVRACAGYVSELCEATYGVAPSFRIEEFGGGNALSGVKGEGEGIRVGGIGVHLEYILTELLKNAFRATVEFHTPKKTKAQLDEEEDIFTWDDLPSGHLSSKDFPEVVVSIGVVEGVLTIRIRDRGGGIEPDNISNVFSYAFTTVPLLQDPDADPDSPGSDLYGGTSGNSGYYGGSGGGGGGGGESSLKTGLGTLAGLGFGLPLSRLYAGYFGGSLDLVSMYGWGTDCYVVLRTVESNLMP